MKSRHNVEDDECHANEPECIRQVITDLDENQKNHLEKAAKEGNVTEISNFIEQKICESPELQTEYHDWNARNNVPQALRDIVDGLSEAQLR